MKIKIQRLDFILGKNNGTDISSNGYSQRSCKNIWQNGQARHVMDNNDKDNFSAQTLPS